MKNSLKVLLIAILIIFAGFQTPMPSAKNLKFEVSLEEANLIIDALQKEPFNKVSGLIQKLYTQAEAQIADTTKPKK